MARNRFKLQGIVLVRLHARPQVYPHQKPGDSEVLVLQARLSRMRLPALHQLSLRVEARLSLHHPGSWHQGGLREELGLVWVEFRMVFLLGVNAVSHKVAQGFMVDT